MVALLNHKSRQIIFTIAGSAESQKTENMIPSQQKKQEQKEKEDEDFKVQADAFGFEWDTATLLEALHKWYAADDMKWQSKLISWENDEDYIPVYLYSVFLQEKQLSKAKRQLDSLLSFLWGESKILVQGQWEKYCKQIEALSAEEGNDIFTQEAKVFGFDYETARCLQAFIEWTTTDENDYGVLFKNNPENRALYLYALFLKGEEELFDFIMKLGNKSPALENLPTIQCRNLVNDTANVDVKLSLLGELMEQKPPQLAKIIKVAEDQKLSTLTKLCKTEKWRSILEEAAKSAWENKNKNESPKIYKRARCIIAETLEQMPDSMWSCVECKENFLGAEFPTTLVISNNGEQAMHEACLVSIYKSEEVSEDIARSFPKYSVRKWLPKKTDSAK